jgi:DNA-binding MarR family transcriptional regulator
LRGNKDNISTVLYIKERLLDKNSDTSRLIDRMLKSGYVDRKVCSKDRRSVDIRINQKGLKLLEEIDYVIKKEFAPLSSLTNKELTEFNKLMDKILSTIES